jgi:hypothetical protein
MLKNKQSTRSLMSFMVTWSFLILTVTGIVLYVVPQGRVAYWVHWSLGGMEKTQWGWVHMMFGGVFIVTGILHLYFNWKPFRNYLAGRVKGHFALKREAVVATVLSVFIFVVSAFNLPPASWVIDLNDSIKASWVTSPELEPPFGHAEEASVAGIARRMHLDLDVALKNLEADGIAFAGQRDSLEGIARANGITPMDVYASIRRDNGTKDLPPPVTAEDIEARYAGTGLGRQTLAELFSTLEVDEALARQRLNAAGIEVSADETAREIADRHDISPVDLVKIMLLDTER